MRNLEVELPLGSSTSKWYAEAKLGYAGRLDPLAEGVMLALVGEENKDRQKYFDLDKEYEFEVLLGFQTESHDVMSRPTKLAEISRSFSEVRVGKKMQEYPKHSSKRIAKNYAEVPPKEVEIYSCDLIKEYSKPANEVLLEIEQKLSQVSGNFNQAEFLREWQETLTPFGFRALDFVLFHAHVSSGTYIRLLAHEMGGLAWRITRTRVGPYRKDDCLEV